MPIWEYVNPLCDEWRTAAGIEGIKPSGAPGLDSGTWDRDFVGSEREVNPDHWLGRMPELVGGREEPGDIGSFVEIAAVLETQAEMRQHTPIQPRAINVHGLGTGLGLKS